MKPTRNKITVKSTYMEVSVTLPEEASLDDILQAMEGIIKALGYCQVGKLDFVEEGV